MRVMFMVQNLTLQEFSEGRGPVLSLYLFFEKLQGSFLYKSPT